MSDKKRSGRSAKRLTWLAVGLGLLSVAGFATANAIGADWRNARRDSAGIAPDPKVKTEAVVQIYAARAFSWRGTFAVHPWISVKRAGADSYSIYQILGWRARRGLPALTVQEGVPDRHWFGSRPDLLVDIQGGKAELIIDKIEAAAKRYPFANEYTLFPGPNSNTFVAWIGRQVPELRLDLPPTAIGKDYLGPDRFFDDAISGTGYQLSLAGLLGLTIAKEEGLEINLAGLGFGIDPGDLNLRLPFIGTLGPKTDTRR
ncbi:DUF3750 domain-containing protein [Aestuariispira insulae]|uniref:Uncharacterized protein DUF3750 n=1 Tax=Aestuariispira insulae TaxID=1461337 RepID=A0A3D9HXA4_9PROT|nr:DUF3750 domain-containing protein [Aestuariispira insulae]RED54049.1 uncharacterized protein DUF3750 [Aestuariispira insulae]